jgi:hypothetical protein
MRAWFERRLILLALLALCVLGSLLAALRMLWCVFFSPGRAWLIAVAHDMLGNAAANGNVGETISSRAGRAAREGRRWGCVLCKLLDRLDPNHCEKNIDARFK